MALLMRPSRSLLRLAAGDATGKASGRAGTRGRAGGGHAMGNPPPPSAYRSSSSPPAVVASADRTGQLERLARLHDAGALTDAEFGTAKAQVLGV
ncbi:MAG TPA: SHOCT domain-containing protein [Acidimicrobiia bacterium]